MSISNCTVMISLRLDFEPELNRCVDCAANNGAGGASGGLSLTMCCWLSERLRWSLSTPAMARAVGECRRGLVSSPVGGGWGRRRLWKRGERAGRLMAIRPMFISTIAHIAGLLLLSVTVAVWSVVGSHGEEEVVGVSHR